MHETPIKPALGLTLNKKLFLSLTSLYASPPHQNAYMAATLIVENDPTSLRWGWPKQTRVHV